jgi:hypothetical protein
MKNTFIFATLILSSSLSFAAKCPIQFGTNNYLDKVVVRISQTSSCEAAAKMAESCALGASGDLKIAPAAVQKCEADFVSKMDSEETKTYKNLRTRCQTKYENQQGTIYLSMMAFCQLNVSRLFSSLYTEVE